MRELHDEGDDDDRGEGFGDRAMDSGQPDHQERDHRHHTECLCRDRPICMRHHMYGCGQSALALRGVGAERGGYLLQEDDDRDTEGEAFDHRPWDEGHRAPESYHSGDQDYQTGEDRDQGDRAEAVTGDDGCEDHGHRAGRSGHLDVRTTEDGGDQTGHDCGDQTGGGSDSRADAECQRQR